jgi:hypothetical protein
MLDRARIRDTLKKNKETKWLVLTNTLNYTRPVG